MSAGAAAAAVMFMMTSDDYSNEGKELTANDD